MKNQILIKQWLKQIFSCFIIFFIGGLVICNASNVTNNDISNLVYDIDSKPFYIPYSDWTEKWWQWAYSIPQNTHPAYDDTGKFCQESQKKPVWFFPGTYQHSVTRYCEIPYGVGILFPILNSECSFAEHPEMKTKEELSICAKQIQDTIIPEFATLNNVEIPNLENYRIQSNIFNLTIPENNILDLQPQITQAVSDGLWVFLKPLEVGNYELKFKGDVKNIKYNETNDDSEKDEFAGPVGWNYTTTYILTVK
ncbi:MAG TPA: hypothetical protein VFK40_08705 [Nitrososphaeraceae archaeon]|nr:hypothetical protein [Nitrososphaeraceae archaeon]